MDAEKQKNGNISDRKYLVGMEGIALFAAFILSVLGIGITNFRPAESYRYWGVMTVILAMTGLLIGWARSRRMKKSVGRMLVVQLVHWGGYHVSSRGHVPPA